MYKAAPRPWRKEEDSQLTRCIWVQNLNDYIKYWNNKENDTYSPVPSWQPPPSSLSWGLDQGSKVNNKLIVSQHMEAVMPRITPCPGSSE